MAPDSPVHVAVAADLAQASMAKNTRRAYEQALRGFERSGRPETDAGIAAYLGELYDHGRSAACAAMLVAALRFRAVCRGGGRLRCERLRERGIRRAIVRRARDAGVDGRAGGHSLRVGSAQSLATAGASLVEMHLAGRWQSPVMPGRYTQGQLAKQGAVARLRYGS